MTAVGVRRQGGAFQWVQAPPDDSLQPEATGAGMEETKCLKPSDSGSRTGDRASVQAATRVNAEQAAKRTKDRLQHQRCRRHADPIPHARDAQRPEFAVGLRYKHSSDWLRPVSLLPERKRQFSQPSLDPIRLDLRKILTVDTRRAPCLRRASSYSSGTGHRRAPECRRG